MKPSRGNRARIGADALRAALGAHRGAAHAGVAGYRCRTCATYTRAVVRAEASEREQAELAEQAGH